jgi:hypothetical protein
MASTSQGGSGRIRFKKNTGDAAAPAPEPLKRERRELTAGEQKELEALWEEISMAEERWRRVKKSHADFRTIKEAALRSRRRGGLFLRKLGTRVTLPLNEQEIKTWKEASAGSDAAFEERLAKLAPLSQQISDFVPDEHGILTRTKANGVAAPA